jgi:predicted histone-like DNA-binding protein
MKYRIIRRVNPLDRGQEKWYASPVNDGRITKAEISKEIVGLSSLSRGDVSNVIESLLDVLPKYLLMGKSVNLGDLGTLRVSFSSEGVDGPNDFTASKIKGARVIFTPSVELKNALATLNYEKVD